MVPMGTYLCHYRRAMTRQCGRLLFRDMLHACEGCNHTLQGMHDRVDNEQEMQCSRAQNRGLTLRVSMSLCSRASEQSERDTDMCHGHSTLRQSENDTQDLLRLRKGMIET